MISPLARRAARMQVGHGSPACARRGLAVHTTGSGLLDAARRRKLTPLAYAERYYGAAKYYPHYVAGWDGTLIAVCDEDAVAWHVGVTAEQRGLLAGDGWRHEVAHPELWDRAWQPHGVTMPAQLWLPASPNRCYVGLELVPLEPADRGREGLWFSPHQHDLVAELAGELVARHGLALTRQVLVGHEDLNPLGRWDKGGGWDPGARRDRPRFDWTRVLARLGL